MVNILRPEKQAILRQAFEAGEPVRDAAARARCSKITANTYFSQWREVAREQVTGDARFVGAADRTLVLKARDILELPPRYGANGSLWDNHRRWSAEDKAAVAVLCAHEVRLDRIEPILARPATAIAWKAEALQLSLPKGWRMLLRPASKPRSRAPDPMLSYPYVIGEARDDHAFMLKVSTVVPRGLPGDLRADVCQDMMLAVLEGELDPDGIAAAMPRFLKAARKRYQMPWGVRSIDEPLWGDGRPLSETLSENPLYEQ